MPSLDHSTKKSFHSPVANRKRGASSKMLSIESPRQLLGIKKRIFSRLAGFSERAITDFESGKKVSDALARRMKELTQFQKRLSRVVKASAIPAWLETPNKAFDGLTPIEVVERGEIDRLWNMIYFLESGTAS
jgi:hypothetical protein